VLSVPTPEYIDNVYTTLHNSIVGNGIEFEWDAMNKRHLAAHGDGARV
jgi:hypothetical protein